MHHVYHVLLKEVNGDHKYLRLPYLWDNKFEVMIAATTLDKIYLECKDIVRAKPTGNYEGFIAYSNTIYFYGL